MARRREIEAAVKAARADALAAAFATAKLTGGPNQTAVAYSLGVTPAQISKFVTGRDLVDAEKAHMLSKALGCRFIDLFRPGRLELAEEPALFRGRDGADDSADLEVLLGTAQARLSPDRTAILRDVALELLAAQEIEGRIARIGGIL